MIPPRTLQSFLSARYLREWAGDKVFQRGEDYYHENCVTIKHHAAEQAVGEVEGTQHYRVEWKLAGPTVVADCTCPAMSQYGFCC